jgi:hypothetical protein
VTLDFLSPSRCAPETLASPLARALAGIDNGRIGDLSLQGKIELRGDVDSVRTLPGEELIRFSPGRALVLVEGDALPVVERLREEELYAYDTTGALAGLAFEGEQVARRLTDLDLESLPAAGSFAKIGVVLVRDEGERFRAYFPQELGHYVAEVVLDALAGLHGEGSDPTSLTPGEPRA